MSKRRRYRLPLWSEFEIASTEGFVRSSGRGVMRNSAQLGALVAVGFLVLGIGGGLIAWLRESQGAGTEQVVSALAIAVVGILAAIVHSAAFLAARRAKESQHELDRERELARQALDRAAEIQAHPETYVADDLPGPDEFLGSRDSSGGTLGWQVERIARYFEADAALLDDLAGSHGQTTVTEAWRKHQAKSRATMQAMQKLIELSSSAKE